MSSHHVACNVEDVTFMEPLVRAVWGRSSFSRRVAGKAAWVGSGWRAALGGWASHGLSVSRALS